jgi:hypothetical protein
MLVQSMRHQQSYDWELFIYSHFYQMPPLCDIFHFLFCNLVIGAAFLCVLSGGFSAYLTMNIIIVLVLVFFHVYSLCLHHKNPQGIKKTNLFIKAFKYRNFKQDSGSCYRQRSREPENLVFPLLWNLIMSWNKKIDGHIYANKNSVSTLWNPQGRKKASLFH